MNDGRPAFPLYCGPGDLHNNEGMSLRDYFAAAALNGLLQNLHVQGALNESLRRNVECSWQIADEMLKQREGEPSAAESGKS